MIPSLLIEVIVKLIIQSIRYFKNFIDTLITQISEHMSPEKISIEIWSWLNDIVEPLADIAE